ncbi:Cytolethal distending toxin A/C family [Salmonella enterica]|uniref:Cytolethal distending toxin A/C family n=1 Tax=Salmonella enterica TaxID=28901 RepID=A0A379QAL7_SALER|nr:hypothetical protein [Salmonella enterica subsp. salamae serovar Springs]SUF38312.1 Cytolethal distending toxin A/C family [Salmonella enterica]HCM1983531.1 hypothetical protein [Salmonella enterica subsp. salamae serovar 40:a:z39]
MRKYLKIPAQVLLSFIFFHGGPVFATDFSPEVTFRSMTGFVFLNALPGSTGEDDQTHFIITGVSDPSISAEEAPGGIVQLREPPGRRVFPACVAISRSMEVLRATNCNDGLITYFTLLPASNGAVQIKSLNTGVCLVGTEGEGIPSTGDCTETDLTVSPDHLWFIAPPFSAAHMSPLT